MPRHFQTALYFLAFIAFCGLFGWRVIVASEHEVKSVEIEKRLAITAENVFAPKNARSPEDDLTLYAVDVVHTALPFRTPFVGDGVYLGRGLILSAAHVVGRAPFLTHPRVLIAGQNVPARVIKEGSLEYTDLALLSVDQEQLPISLRLRRLPICKGAIRAGRDVIVVYPERIVHSRIISPAYIQQQFRARFSTLIQEPEGSGSGVFDARRKCLLGIVSRKITKYAYRKAEGKTIAIPDGFAGYFVPASDIAGFLPTDLRY